MSLNLISKSDFVGFKNIQFSETEQVFDVYALQMEQKIIPELFGSAMYNDMLANPTEPDYVYLIDTYLKSMQKGFFYYYFLPDRESYSSTMGEFSSDAENAERNRASRNDKTTQAYNDALVQYIEAFMYVNDNIDKYPLYTETKPRTPLNVWGINKTFSNDVSYPYDHDDWFIRGSKQR